MQMQHRFILQPSSWYWQDRTNRACDNRQRPEGLFRFPCKIDRGQEQGQIHKIGIDCRRQVYGDQGAKNTFLGGNTLSIRDVGPSRTLIGELSLSAETGRSIRNLNILPCQFKEVWLLSLLCHAIAPFYLCY